MDHRDRTGADPTLAKFVLTEYFLREPEPGRPERVPLFDHRISDGSLCHFVPGPANIGKLLQICNCLA